MYNVAVAHYFKSILMLEWDGLKYRVLVSFFGSPKREKERTREKEKEWYTWDTIVCVCVCACASNSCKSALRVCVCVCMCVRYHKFFFFFLQIVHRSPISFAIRVSGTFSFSYWTPSRCAKILIDKCATVPPASLFISVMVSYSCVIGRYGLIMHTVKCKMNIISLREAMETTVGEKNVPRLDRN